MLSCDRYCSQVRFVLAGIPDGLILDEGSVAKKMGEHDKFRLSRLAGIQWRGYLPGYGNT
jgi:hypothetical protein